MCTGIDSNTMSKESFFFKVLICSEQEVRLKDFPLYPRTVCLITRIISTHPPSVALINFHRYPENNKALKFKYGDPVWRTLKKESSFNIMVNYSGFVGMKSTPCINATALINVLTSFFLDQMKSV